MNTGTLTPRSNDTVNEMRFTGNFGQPDGFGSVLTVSIRKDGAVCLTLTWKDLLGDEEKTWSVMLTSDQRPVLAQLLDSYNPKLWEKV